MDTVQIIGVVSGVVGTPLAVFGAYVGVKQLVEWRREKKGDTDHRLASRLQTFTKEITSAAWAGDVTLATANIQKVLVHAITVRSNGATTADLTTIAVYACTGKRATLIDTTQGAQVNLAADGNQISSDFGLAGCQLKATETIVAVLTGTGATAVDFTVEIVYSAVVKGGYLA
jgi:hypothetical protein